MCKLRAQRLDLDSAKEISGALNQITIINSNNGSIYWVPAVCRMLFKTIYTEYFLKSSQLSCETCSAFYHVTILGEDADGQMTGVVCPKVSGREGI